LFNQNNSKYALIPAGMTKFLQSLDLSINKPFKNYMYHKFNEWKIANDFKFKPNENNIIDWIVSV
jgi:hypothetical protein